MQLSAGMLVAIECGLKREIEACQMTYDGAREEDKEAANQQLQDAKLAMDWIKEYWKKQ